MLLCDIGNSGAKFFDGVRVWKESLLGLEKYRNRQVCYVNVNLRAHAIIKNFAKWVDIAPHAELESDYEGLGVDRKVLCSYFTDGVIVDAGSAITVDIMEQGKHLGGYIYPGIKAMHKAYTSISKALDKEPEFLPPKKIARNTAQAIGYGVLAPLLCDIKSWNKRVYITGGSGKILRHFLRNATYDRLYLFKAMKSIVQRKKLC
ncbi:type III pantothenate kinase [Nitratiruptor sp. YY09-18]|uniref:type III pantothenate kinase n=1 Tax=Nitratiruptor sp. YY09-18 TaxID=2724901 RepID=UPI001915F323|nr:type III pantothenate kinase [Nitratiruptor sp. YY09-18]BCD67829.1 type III pantothenate kinase [Nitratiruptor sp. YY09-18]